MMTTTEAPVRGLLTLTLVPNGSDLCAAVRPSGRDADPAGLYWVAFIEAPGQASWADPAKAVPPDQVETSNRRVMIFNSIGYLGYRKIGRRSRQNLMTLQPHRITAAPTATAMNGTIDPEADNLSSEAMWNPMNDPAMPTSALVT
jgi:hypothetical protein